MSPRYYPAFIDLRGKTCVVVGGGKVAERKVLSLLRSGAAVRIVSPEITGTLRKQKDKGIIEHIKRGYRKGDLKGAFLVIAATSDYCINAKVSHDAACLVNVVDEPELANFIVPSLINRGPLAIAVSTSGASPAVAKAIRKELESMYGTAFGLFLEVLKKLRKKAVQEITDKQVREDFLKGAASERVLAVLRDRGFKEAKKRVVESFETARRISSGSAMQVRRSRAGIAKSPGAKG